MGILPQSEGSLWAGEWPHLIYFSETNWRGGVSGVSPGCHKTISDTPWVVPLMGLHWQLEVAHGLLGGVKDRWYDFWRMAVLRMWELLHPEFCFFSISLLFLFSFSFSPSSFPSLVFRGILYSEGWPGTHCLTEVGGLELLIPVSISLVLESQGCASRVDRSLYFEDVS